MWAEHWDLDQIGSAVSFSNNSLRELNRADQIFNIISLHRTSKWRDTKEHWSNPSMHPGRVSWLCMLMCFCHRGPHFRCKTSCAEMQSYWNFSSLLLIFQRGLQMFTWLARDIQAFSNDPLPCSLLRALEAGRKAGCEPDDKLQRDRRAVLYSLMVSLSVSNNLHAWKTAGASLALLSN